MSNAIEQNPSLRKLQLCELQLLKYFQQICEEHNIRYFALGGTLLGAIRHKGFIPWDDDIDIGVPRPDYEKLCEILKKNSDTKVKFKTYKNDESHIRYFGQLEDTSLKIIRNDKLKAEETFAWIDIFPLDPMPNNKILRKIKVFYVLILRALFRFSCFDKLVDVNKKNRPIHEKILVWIGLHTPIQKFLNTKKCLTRLEKTLTNLDYEKSNYLVNVMGAYKFREMFHKKYYGEGRMYPFEDTEICGPEDYDFVCTQLYGDYKKPPAQNDRNHHKIANIEEVK